MTKPLRTTTKQRNPRMGGVTGRGFTPGESGNPGGRPKGFAAELKKHCGKNYEKLAAALAAIAFGNAKTRRAFFGEPTPVTTRDRLSALEMMRDSGPGRPVTNTDVELPPQVPAFILPPGCKGISVH